MAKSTIVALSTPSGIGAIALIRLSGLDAFAITQAIFKGKILSQQNSHTAHFGYIIDGQSIIDEVVVTIYKSPNSFTKENVVEIGCHGSSYIVQQIIKLLLKNGAEMAQPGEFTQRAFLNGRMDLAQAEAVADLIASETAASHATAINQMKGGFSKRIKQLREELIHFASMIELELDFSEEDVEFASREGLKSLLHKIQAVISPLIDSFDLGNVIKNGVPVVIAGRPNAGKSTLLNTLLNDERAIVSDIAGTTRDTIEEILVINGIQFRLIDTAGIREAQDQIEAIGISKSKLKVAQANLVMYVFDIELPVEEVIADVKNLDKQEEEVLLVANKSDKILSSKIPKAAIAISAKEGLQIEELKKALYDRVLGGKIAKSDSLITNLRHYEALRNTQTALENAQKGIDASISGDFLAMDIRQALFFLGEITGEITTDDLLENIFSKFCIGK